jgi:hypothetical protein
VLGGFVVQSGEGLFQFWRAEGLVLCGEALLVKFRERRSWAEGVVLVEEHMSRGDERDVLR